MLQDRPRELTLTVHYRTDVGRVRNHNQDSLGYREPKELGRRAEDGWLYAVADGLGGHQAGEVASRLAVQALLTAYYRSRQGTPADRLRRAFADANHAVYERARQQTGPRRMGTTLVAAVARGEELIVANVGDSRAYLVRGGRIRQITRDHSLIAQLVAEAIVTPEQAKTHPQRHVLTRSLGTHSEMKVDLFTETFLPGDQLLLCSDGVTEHVTDAEIGSAMRDRDPEAIAQRLVDLANERGGRDNITVLILRAMPKRKNRLPSPVLPQKVEKPPISRRRPGPGSVVT